MSYVDWSFSIFFQESVQLKKFYIIFIIFCKAFGLELKIVHNYYRCAWLTKSVSNCLL